MASKPKLFIGSSVEGRTVAYAVQQNLQYDAEVTVWDQSVFELSGTAIESLMAAVEASDFGIFVFSPDDITKMRGAKKSVARDNVIFELGLFIGKLGRARTFVIIPDKSDLHIPTDLLGVTMGKFDSTRSDENLQAGTGAFCHQVRGAIHKLGMLPEHEIASKLHEEQAESTTTQQAVETEKETNWIDDLIEKRYDDAIVKLSKILENEEDEEKIHSNKIFIIHCQILKDLRPGLEKLATYLEANSDKLIVWQRVAATYYYVGQRAQAKATIKDGLIKFPDDPRLTLLSADILTNQGDVISSVSILRTNSSKDTGLILQLCNYLESELEDKEQALLIIHKAYNDNPAPEAIRYKFARLAQDTGRNELALFLFNGLKNEFSDNATYLTYFANICVALSLNDLAFQSYKRANEIAQEKAGWILNNIGNLLKTAGLYEEGKEYFLKGQAANKNSSYMYERMAELLKLQEEEGKKFEKLRKVGRVEALNAPSYLVEDIDSEPVEPPKLIVTPGS